MTKGKVTHAKAAKRDASGGTGLGLLGVAKAIDGLSEEFGKVFYLETLADNAGHMSVALDSLAHATAMSVIARYGTEHDKEIAITYLKRWFWDDFKES